MSSISSKNPILPFMDRDASTRTHSHGKDAELTIADCDPKVINVFKRFLVDLNNCPDSLTLPSRSEERIIGNAAEKYIDSIQNLKKNPTTYSSTIIAITIFNQLLRGKKYFNQSSLDELKTALHTFLSGSETLKRHIPTHPDGSRVSRESIERDSTAEIEGSSRSIDSPLTISTDPSSQNRVKIVFQVFFEKIYEANSLDNTTDAEALKNTSIINFLDSLSSIGLSDRAVYKALLSFKEYIAPVASDNNCISTCLNNRTLDQLQEALACTLCDIDKDSPIQSIHEETIPEEIKDDTYPDDFFPPEDKPISAAHLPARALRT